MKMIRAVIRPEREEAVLSGLEAAGFPAVTKLDVLGRGKQKGIQVGNAIYDELAKTMVMLVVEDDKLPAAIEAIRAGAVTGNPGDGKLIVSPVEQVYTIRTGRTGL
ncbi:MAG: nitrogen fixation protein NifD [Elusimicrobia bacterium RIFCSPLOWO2_01_FULL_59_12]|nr:MAG: nitrogen fixation protein NifD [Elusimicrobia bacterium RIFCSPLOWO2_01_FULL_59_12]